MTLASNTPKPMKPGAHRDLTRLITRTAWGRYYTVHIKVYLFIQTDTSSRVNGAHFWLREALLYTSSKVFASDNSNSGLCSVLLVEFPVHGDIAINKHRNLV